MNLARHAAVLWRFRSVAAAGLLLGFVLAILGSYQVHWNGSPSVTPRGSETWSATSSILVTQPGFPEGRVTLPTSQIDGVTTADGQPAVKSGAAPKDQVEFADPGRLASLADLYSTFLTSDEVRARVPEHPGAGQIQASPFSAAAGGQVKPVIQLVTTASSSDGARRLNLHLIGGLRSVLAEQQAANRISTAGRVELKVIDPPTPTLASGRKHIASILAFLLCLIGTVAVAHLLAAVRDRNDPEALASIIAWETPEESDSAVPESELAREHVGTGGWGSHGVASGRLRR
jgi:hypothetical protein